jgi:hypothetical protein
VEGQSNLSYAREKLPIVKTPIKVKPVVVPDTVDLLQLLSCTAEFQPSEMTYPLHLEDKVNTPDVASDLHQGYNDPLPQDAQETRFSDRPNLKKQYPLQEMEVPHR